MLGSSWASLLSLAFVGFVEREQIQAERVSCCPSTCFVSKGAWSHYIADKVLGNGSSWGLGRRHPGKKKYCNTGAIVQQISMQDLIGQSHRFI